MRRASICLLVLIYGLFLPRVIFAAETNSRGGGDHALRIPIKYYQCSDPIGLNAAAQNDMEKTLFPECKIWITVYVGGEFNDKMLIWISPDQNAGQEPPIGAAPSPPPTVASGESIRNDPAKFGLVEAQPKQPKVGAIVVGPETPTGVVVKESKKFSIPEMKFKSAITIVSPNPQGKAEEETIILDQNAPELKYLRPESPATVDLQIVQEPSSPTGGSNSPAVEGATSPSPDRDK